MVRSADPSRRGAVAMIPADDFRLFVSSRLGCEPPPRIEPGRFVRFPTSGKRDDDAGYAKLFADGRGGIVGDFRTGAYHVWQAKPERPLTEGERLAWRERIERERREAVTEREREEKEAAQRAVGIWNSAPPAPADHDYLAAKRIEPHGVRVYRGPLAAAGMRCDGALIVPVRNLAGEIQTLEFIALDGQKRFLPRGRKSGGYYSIGKVRDVLCIAEGFATGASVQEATGHAVAVAFDAGNLEAVARALRAQYPQAKIVIAGDNDASGTGQRAAEAAARAVGGLIATPAPGKDWNDVHREQGAEAVARALANARAPVAAKALADHQAPIVALEIGELLQREFPPMESLLSPWLRR